MLEGKTKAEMDQALAFLTEFHPPLWRRLYLRNIEEGLTESESLQLIKAYIHASCGGNNNG